MGSGSTASEFEPPNTTTINGHQCWSLGLLKRLECGCVDVPSVAHSTGDETIIHQSRGARGWGDLIVGISREGVGF